MYSGALATEQCKDISAGSAITEFTVYTQVTTGKILKLFTWGADKSLARTTCRCILFDLKNISFEASLVICISSTNIPPIMIINRTYEYQNLQSL